MPVGRIEIVDFWIESMMVSFNHDRNGFIHEFLFYLSGHLISWVILILKGENNFIFRIILDAKALKIAKQIVLQSLEGLRIEMGGKN